ncbi:MAG: glycosyltransferase family 2 protein [Planctomycetia bacterium]|nr:glycosyltransferase family 2 protein [Planctomycetia bacterium]
MVEELFRQAEKPRLSVIIPAINEAQYLSRCLDSIPGNPGIEVIVVDGGSTDKTVEIAKSRGATVVSGGPGRASQMNAGAAIAIGDSLMFLHADTCLPPNGTREIARLMAMQGTALAAFRLGFDRHSIGLRCIGWLANFRSRVLKMPYGDQAFCVRTERFHLLKGFKTLPFMEDFEFVRRVRRCGVVRLSNLAVCTSARRWLRDGILRTTLVNQACIFGFLFGVSPRTLVMFRGRGTSNKVAIAQAPPLPFAESDRPSSQSSNQTARLRLEP